jgi:hypothetical protein
MKQFDTPKKKKKCGDDIDSDDDDEDINACIFSTPTQVCIWAIRYFWSGLRPG